MGEYIVPIYIDPMTCIPWPVNNAADHTHAEGIAKTEFIAGLRFGPAMNNDEDINKESK